MCKLFETVQSALIDNITSLDRPYACDLHNALYNERQHYIYYADAEEVTAELGVWYCIAAVQKYEQDQFGKVYTPLWDACEVANMVVYVLGEALLQAIYAGTDFDPMLTDDDLTDDDLADMLTIAEKWFEENPNGLQEIWDNLDID